MSLTKYRIINDKEKVKLKLDNYITLPERSLSMLSKKIIKKEKLGRKLNKKNNAKFITDKKRAKVYSLAKNNGFFMLNGFADCYRKSIKISYPTLYRRIYKDKNILKTLIELGYIDIYHTKKTTNLKELENSTKKNYLKVKVSYEKRFEFIKFIKKYFLTEEQKYDKL